MADLGRCNACGQNPAVGVCNCLLGQPISLAYCRRCISEGIESWWLISATVEACTLGYGCTPEQWRIVMAPWAVEIIDRSMAFHGKTEAELIEAVKQP